MRKSRTKPPVSEVTEYLSIASVAVMVDVAELSVRRWIADGRLAAYYVGPLVRVKRTDLEAFLRPVAATQPTPVKARRKAKVSA